MVCMDTMLGQTMAELATSKFSLGPGIQISQVLTSLVPTPFCSGERKFQQIKGQCLSLGCPIHNIVNMAP